MAISIGLSVFAVYEIVNINNKGINQTAKADSFELLLKDNGYTIQRVTIISQIPLITSAQETQITFSTSQFMGMLGNDNYVLGNNGNTVYRLGNSFYENFDNGTQLIPNLPSSASDICYLLETTP